MLVFGIEEKSSLPRAVVHDLPSDRKFVQRPTGPGNLNITLSLLSLLTTLPSLLSLPYFLSLLSFSLSLLSSLSITAAIVTDH